MAYLNPKGIGNNSMPVKQWSCPGSLFIDCEEVESDDGFEHALVLFYRRSVPAAFFAEHAPGLEGRDGVFDSGADFAQRSVEFGLSGGEIDIGQSFDRDEFDALDTDIA